MSTETTWVHAYSDLISIEKEEFIAYVECTRNTRNLFPWEILNGEHEVVASSVATNVEAAKLAVERALAGL